MDDHDLPAILREEEYRDDWYITWSLPRRRPQPLFVLAPFAWLWRLLERVYWQVRGWPSDE
jgi:hypothetical protein